MSRPRVTTSCVADRYHAPNERIIEFSSNGRGGLISFRELDNGTLAVEVYRTDPGVWIHVGEQAIEARPPKTESAAT